MQNRINVIIIEDHTILRELLAESLTAKNGISVVGQWKDAENALVHLTDKRVDIAIVDNYLPYPGMSGIDFTMRACAQCPSLKVIILTMDANERVVRKAFQAGAAGYVLKTAPVEELKFAIRAVLRGQSYISTELTRCILFDADPSQNGQNESLNPDDDTVLMLEKARDGLSNKAIADLLGIPISMVKARFARLMKRLNAKDRTETVVIAMRKGIININ